MRPPPAAQRADAAGAGRPGQAREAAEAHLNAGIRAAFASEVAHHLLGRVRLRVPQLKGDAALVGLASALARRAGIHSVRAAPACASLSVEYDPALVSVARVRAWLGEAVAPPPSSEVAPPERVNDRGNLVALQCGAGALALSAAGARCGCQLSAGRRATP